MSDQKRTLTPRVIVQLLFFVVLIPFLPLLISWHWDWWQAWVYALSSILNFSISRILIAQRSSDLIAERARTRSYPVDLITGSGILVTRERCWHIWQPLSF